MELLIPIAMAAGLVTMFFKYYQTSKEQLAALNAWCDAGDKFTEWRLRNAGVYLGLSEEGRKLLAQHVKAYDWFLKTHPFVDGTQHRDWLMSLFNEFPPKPPHSRLATREKERIKVRSFLYGSGREQLQGFKSILAL